MAKSRERSRLSPVPRLALAKPLPNGWPRLATRSTAPADGEPKQASDRSRCCLST